MALSDEQMNPGPPLPLSGYRVLDLAGPMGVYCGKLMADMGADVIKVEPPGGDPMRDIGPFIDGQPGPGRSLYWLHFNTNKRSVTLDIESPEGAATLRKLAITSDVLLETGPPGYMDSLGLGYERMAADSPGLVYASITPFGQTGPYRDFKASDLVGFAMGGYMYVTGWPHTPPTRLWGSQAYHTASNRAYIAILLALYHRMATGEGQYIDVSMQEAVAATTEHVNTTYNYTGESAGALRVPTRRPVRRHLAVQGRLRQHHHQHPGGVGRPTSLDAPGRHGRRPDGCPIRRPLRAARRTFGSHRETGPGVGHAAHATGDHRVRAVEPPPVGAGGYARRNPGERAAVGRGYLTTVESPDGVWMVYPGDPYRLSEFPRPLRRPAPAPGEHNAEVLSSIK